MARSTGDLVVGVDAGGTKTHALVCDRAGRVHGFGSAGAANWETVGLRGTQQAVADAVDAALAHAGAGREQVGAAGYGLAGLDWPDDVAALEAVVDTLGLQGPRVLVNDAFIALRAGCREPHGIVSSAGTGCVAAGRNTAGETFRTMAIGYGERGGSSDLTAAALHAIALEYHGSGEATLLTPRVLQAAGMDSTPALFEALSRRRFRVPESVPRLVLATADAGDAAAAGIAAALGGELAAAAVGVARRLGMADEPFVLVRSGSVQLAGCRALDERFTAVIAGACPGATLLPLTAPPVIGAVLLALDRFGASDAALHERLADEARAAVAARELRSAG